MIQLQYKYRNLEGKMNLKASYDSRFYRISKIFVMFIIIFTIGAGYNNKIRLSESIMIIIICILLLFILSFLEWQFSIL